MVDIIEDVILTLRKNGVYLNYQNGTLKTKSAKGAMTEEVIAIIKNNRDNLIRYFESVSLSTKLVRKQRNLDAPLSYSQYRLWVLDQVGGGSPQYNMSSAMWLRGDLNITAFKKALFNIIQRHEVLRTRFSMGSENDVVQLVEKVENIREDDYLTITSIDGGEENIAQFFAKESVRSFDLSQDLMIRVHLASVNSAEHIVVFTMHHIASDGWSLKILVDEFSNLYSAYV
ncbi:condensation domain-containing protein, partial [Gilvimarinus sp. SDUM040013]